MSQIETYKLIVECDKILSQQIGKRFRKGFVEWFRGHLNEKLHKISSETNWTYFVHISETNTKDIRILLEIREVYSKVVFVPIRFGWLLETDMIAGHNTFTNTVERN
jgi:hypothetical protein